MMRKSLGIMALAALLQAPSPAMASGVCWQCVTNEYGPGWMCVSTSWAGYADCIPHANQYCELGPAKDCNGECACCTCIRIPDDGRKTSLSLHTLLFKLPPGLESGEVKLGIIHLGGDQNGPAGVRATLASTYGLDDPASFELVGQSIDSDLGGAATRYLDEDRRGIVVNAQASGENSLVRVVMVAGGEPVGSTSVVELRDRDFGVARVNLADADLLCAYYVTTMGQDRDPALQSAHSKEYFDAGKDLWGSQRLPIVADVPELEPSNGASSEVMHSTWLPRRFLAY